jgi:DNA-binding NarL/FixJ family response regulator
MTIRVVVADDDDTFRKAAVRLLETDPRISVIGEAADGDALVDLALITEPDLILLDVRMPGGGPAAARAVAGLAAATNGRWQPLVVAVTAETSADIIESMLRAGVVGYVAKGRIGSTLGDIVARVYDGEVVLAAPTAIRALRRLLREIPTTVVSEP